MKLKPLHYKIIVGVLVFVAYVSSIGYDFTLDDKIVIHQSERVQEGITADNVAFFWNNNIFSETDIRDVNSYRPMLTTSLAMDSSLYGAEKASGWHFSNVLMAIVLALLVFTLIHKHFGFEGSMWAVIITLLYMIHPMKVESIANIKGRDDLMAMICLVGVLLNVAGEMKWHNWALVCLFSFIGVFSKESMVFAPVAVVGFVWLIKKLTLKQALVRSIPVVVFAGFYLLARQAALEGVETVAPALKYNAYLALGEDWMVRAAGGFSILYGAVSTLIPIGRTHHYYLGDFPSEPFVAYIGIIVLVGIVALGVWALIKKKHMLAFCLGCIGAFAIPISNAVFTLPNAFNDRSWFFPSLFLLILGCWLLRKVLKKPGYILILCVVYAGITFSYSAAWKNDDTLTEYYMEHSDSYLTYLVDADGLIAKKDYARAMVEIDKAVDMVGHYYTIYEKKGAMYAEQNLHDSTEKFFSLAIESAEVEGNNANEKAYQFMAIRNFTVKEYDVAMDYLDRGLARHGASTVLWAGKGDIALFGFQDTAKAIVSYEHAIANFDPKKDKMDINSSKKNLEILNRTWSGNKQ